MPLALRWLSLLLLLVAAARAAQAHPIREDSLSVTLSAHAVELEVRSTLRPIVVAVGATPQQGSSFAPAEMAALAQAHTAYLERHLSLRVNDQLLVARDTRADPIEPLLEPVQAHADLERYHARFLLTRVHSGTLGSA